MGRVSQQSVIILIDGGSTHNFMHERLVRSLGLKAQLTHPLQVVVGNGNELACHQLCSGVMINIQGPPPVVRAWFSAFSIDLHVLPLYCADMVLSVQWLKSLGPILIDYNDLTLKFIHDGKMIELKGNVAGALQPVTPTQLRRMVQTDGASAFFHICILNSDKPSPTFDNDQYP